MKNRRMRFVLQSNWEGGLKVIIIALFTSLICGLSSSFFLESLEFVGTLHKNYPWLVYFLPLAGAIIAALYYFFAPEAEGGNNLIINEIKKEKDPIPSKMAPFILFSTLLSHLVGASVGREGTAIQMAASWADPLSRLFKKTLISRELILQSAVAGGFAAIFGTPLAGILFSFEIFMFKNFKLSKVLYILLVSYLSDFICIQLGTTHPLYTISSLPKVSTSLVFWLISLGSVFGLAALLYKKTALLFSNTFKHFGLHPVFRAMIGGIVLMLAYVVLELDTYKGLGIATIEASFLMKQTISVFLIKMVLTTFALGAGFKGGEVTPLFFIGATLGSALTMFCPMPVSFLAGLGFVSVFAGATNTPLASAVLGVELFGLESLPFILISCTFSFLFSGKSSIYQSQDANLYKILKM
jgi:H+/Cl- antiporter ClcA